MACYRSKYCGGYGLIAVLTVPIMSLHSFSGITLRPSDYCSTHLSLLLLQYTDNSFLSFVEFSEEVQ